MHVLLPFEKESKYRSSPGFSIHLSGTNDLGDGKTTGSMCTRSGVILTRVSAGMVKLAPFRLSV